jgi:hypothetical protein
MQRIAELCTLANDPAAFAKLRHEMLQAYLDTLPPDQQSSALELQRRIDMEAAVAANPGHTAERLLEMIGDRIGLLETMGSSLGNAIGQSGPGRRTLR